MRHYLAILLLLILSLSVRAEQTGAYSFACGTWIDIKAEPYEGYRFVRWADGTTDPVLHVEVMRDSSFIAFFANACLDATNWPLVALYDWLLMIDVVALNDTGFHFTQQDVFWYRVVGDVDEIDAKPEMCDDEVVATGYYLTIDQSLKGTGDYYAEVHNVVNSRAALCYDKIRTWVAHYSGREQEIQVSLLPTNVRKGDYPRLTGLPVGENVMIRVYSTNGKLLLDTHSTGERTMYLPTDFCAGCYMVWIQGDNVNQTIRFMIVER